MLLPPTNGYRILIYGRDFTLLDTRRMLLASTGFQADVVSTLSELGSAVHHAQPPYDLVILCHTISTEERAMVRHLIENTGIGLYQLERLVPPKRFMTVVSEMAFGDADSSLEFSFTRRHDSQESSPLRRQSKYPGSFSRSRYPLRYFQDPFSRQFVAPCPTRP